MDKIDNEWIKMYGKAKKYFNEHGNFEIDYESKNDEIKELYIWISEQCRKRRDNSLNPYKIELLNPDYRIAPLNSGIKMLCFSCENINVSLRGIFQDSQLFCIIKKVFRRR